MSTLPELSAHVRRFDDTTGKRMRLLAFAELTIGGAFTIKSIRVLARREGTEEERRPYVVFPAERRLMPGARDKWYDVAHPCSPEARAAALSVILAEYARSVEVAS